MNKIYILMASSYPTAPRVVYCASTNPVLITNKAEELRLSMERARFAYIVSIDIYNGETGDEVEKVFITQKTHFSTLQI